MSRTKNICYSAYGGGRPDDVPLLLAAAPHVPQHALLLPPPALQVRYRHFVNLTTTASEMYIDVGLRHVSRKPLCTVYHDILLTTED